MADNLSNKQIAKKLFVSLNTTKTHIKNIYLKLEVDSRNKAILKTKQLGIM
jgi:LuxR family transcriptional regulator, maltose regulon positive regulatory protein